MAHRIAAILGEQVVSTLKQPLVQIGVAVVCGLISLAFLAGCVGLYIEASDPSCLFRAVRSKDLAKLQSLLRTAPEWHPAALADWRRRFLEHEDEDGRRTPLALAVQEKLAGCVAALLAAGADHAHANPRDRSTPLHAAARAGSWECVMLLLGAGADAFVFSARCTPYHYACIHLCGLPAPITPQDAQNVEVVRAMERSALFAGHVKFQVPWLMGFCQTWKTRWAVVVPAGHYSLSADCDDDEVTQRGLRGRHYYRELRWFTDDDRCIRSFEARLDGAQTSFTSDGQPTMELKLQRGQKKPHDVTVITSRDSRHSILLRNTEIPGHMQNIQRIAALIPGAVLNRGHLEAQADAASHSQQAQQEEQSVQTVETVVSGVGAPVRGSSQRRSNSASADDDNLCVICLDAQAVAGFVHASTVHRCACRACADRLFSGRYGPRACPICRATVERVLTVY